MECSLSLYRRLTSHTQNETQFRGAGQLQLTNILIQNNGKRSQSRQLFFENRVKKTYHLNNSNWYT